MLRAVLRCAVPAFVPAVLVGSVVAGGPPSSVIDSYDELNADQIIDFDDLPLGPLSAGDPIAPGVTFGGAGPDFLQVMAEVVETPGGGRAIRSVLACTTFCSATAIQFNTPPGVRAFAATWTPVSVGEMDGNAATTFYDTEGNYMTSGGTNFSFTKTVVAGSRLNLETPVAGYFEYTYSTLGIEIIYEIDDLHIEYRPECLADIDGNGVVNSDDLGILLGAFGGTEGADLNFDGAVNSDDLGILLSAFGSACS
ncbi:MAG: hypothetical protein ACTS3F_10865 [Phycisphaerales bacterium]